MWKYQILLCALTVKVKLSCNRPWRPIGLWDIKDPTLCSDCTLHKQGYRQFRLWNAQDFFSGFMEFVPCLIFQTETDIWETGHEKMGRHLVSWIQHWSLPVDNESQSTKSTEAPMIMFCQWEIRQFIINIMRHTFSPLQSHAESPCINIRQLEDRCILRYDTNLVDRHHCFQRACLQLQGREVFYQVDGGSRVVPIYQIIWCHISDDSLHRHQHKNFRPHRKLLAAWFLNNSHTIVKTKAQPVWFLSVP
jgi:hypothetical protein